MPSKLVYNKRLHDGEKVYRLRVFEDSPTSFCSIITFPNENFCLSSGRESLDEALLEAGKTIKHDIENI